MTYEVHVVDRPDALRGLLDLIDEPVVGVDVERADAPRYFRTAALVQVGTADHVLLVDTVAMPTVPPSLSQFLCDRVSILHACENDLEPLRSAGIEVGEVVDTGVAAALLGLPMGLDPLLQEILGVALSPDKSKYQRANWERRPLPQGMIDYAAGDVVHLAELWEHLAARLDERDRRVWYDEEVEARVEQAFTDTRAWTRTKGAGRLSPERRAVLKELWSEREAIAMREDLAPNRVLREGTLADLAQKPAGDVRDLMERNPRRNLPGRGHAEMLFAAQERGLDADPIPKSDGGRFGDEERRAYDALRQTRARIADDLGIDAGVMAPSRQLQQAVRSEPTSAWDLCRKADLLTWQGEVLAGPLWAAYTAAFTEDDSDDSDDSD